MGPQQLGNRVESQMPKAWVCAILPYEISVVLDLILGCCGAIQRRGKVLY
jgi:hypothetical protein